MYVLHSLYTNTVLKPAHGLCCMFRTLKHQSTVELYVCLFMLMHICIILFFIRYYHVYVDTCIHVPLHMHVHVSIYYQHNPPHVYAACSLALVYPRVSSLLVSLLYICISSGTCQLGIPAYTPLHAVCVHMCVPVYFTLFWISLS